jgi:hypothetical protein
MTKIVGFMPLHYGLSYVEYAIRSVIDDVDQFVVAYSPIGSHGHRTDVPCPEHAYDLHEACKRAAGDKLLFYTGLWSQENQQRAMAFELAPDADYIISIDSDEVYMPGLVQESVEYLIAHSDVAYLRLPFLHWYKSFRRAILHDPAFPARVTAARSEGEKGVTLPTDKHVCHFGYAQPSEIIQYKMSIHGHSAELRPNWFETIYSDPNRWNDVHPVGSEFWNAEVIEPLDYMPAWMAEHPFYNLDIIP